ncbi:MAG TPA: hypothetical protein VJS44_04690 [Pyrinomonadaceae bacterium]|nr:hypothetical protein [Pyrinomonadaceae bacterium]
MILYLLFQALHTASALHLFWFTVTCSDAIADILIAFYSFRSQSRFGKFMGIFLVGLSVEAVIAAASLLIFWQIEVEVAPAFAISRTIGRTIKMLCAWTLFLYLNLWVRKGDAGQHTSIG